MKKLSATILFLLAILPGVASGRETVAILGDSYSTFEGYVEPASNAVWYFAGGRDYTDVDSLRQTWWQLLARDGGYKIGVNNSYSGSTICRTGYNGDDYTDRAFITRMSQLGDPDILLIFGATNDSWADAPIGDYKYSGWTPMELYSFRPAMARMLDWLTGRYPNVDIRFILNTDLKPEIAGSVRTICSRYGVPVIELRDIDKVSGHPSVKGMRQIADQVLSSLRGR